ncbi:MAG: CvpA family protein [Bacteroidales bacterium]|nr:CvpA family protein [Bacteroidales bacterium]
MVALDILILAIVAVGGAIGFSRGLLSQVGQIAAVIIGIILCRLFGQTLSDFFAGSDDASAYDYVAGYAIVFLIGYGITWLVARMLRQTVRAVRLGILDRIGGAAFKVAQWGLLLSLALNIVLLITGDEKGLRHPEKPWRAAAIDFAPAVLGYLGDITNFTHAKDVNTSNSESSDNG